MKWGVVLADYIAENCTLYESLIKGAKDYSDDIAVSFYDKTFTYKTLFEKIDETAMALRALGIGKDDVVVSSLPGTPEGIFLIYAVNKIGAVYCAFDCRSRHDEIRETIDVFSPKLCVAPDFQIKEFAGIYDCPVVCINPGYSTGVVAKTLAECADFFMGRKALFAKQKNIIQYKDFISKASEFSEDVIVEKSSDDLFGYFHSSGTTYGRKSIIITNENILSAVQQHRITNEKTMQRGESILNIMPLFTCYSVVHAVHFPLIAGVKIILEPLFKPKMMKKLLVSRKPNYLVSVPAHWEGFLKENFDNCDLSFIKNAVAGGDAVGENFKATIDAILKKCGSNASLMVGYGLTESASSVTSAVVKAPKGSVGYPLAFTQVAICEKDTDKVLPTGEKGEICISGPNICKGYYKDEKLTASLLQLHSDGKVWLHTGDCGYLDESGALYYCERFKRMYVRFDGTKISPYSIEQVILGSEVVEKCMVTAIKDTEHSHGMCAKAYVVLKKDVRKKDAEEQVRRHLKKHLYEHMIPKEIEFVDKLRYTKNGKLDYFRK